MRDREDRLRRALQRSLLVLLALVLCLLAAATADGQEVPTHRFYGLKGDVTIDGRALEPGETIIAWHEDREIGRTTVLADGSWLIDVEVEQFPDRCSVRFSVQSVVGTHSWTNCNLRVKMAFEEGKQVEPAPPSVKDEDDPTDESDVEAEPVEEDDQPADEDVELDEDTAAPEGDQSAEDEEDRSEDSQEEDEETGEPVQLERVTPKAPGTGSGGLLARGTGVASWVWAGAAVALSAVLFAYRRRRSQDG